MIETQNINLHSSIHKTFTDIVDTILQKVQEDVCKNICRTEFQSFLKNIESSSQQIQNGYEMDSNRIDKTIKIQKITVNQNLISAKTIHKATGNSQSIQHNPEWDFLQDLQKGEIYHTLKIQSQFPQIVKAFVQFARKQKLVMSQQTSSFVTVKKGESGSCRCLLKIWSNSQPNATVYQLRKYGKINDRAKLILIEGQQIKFHGFYLQLLKHLNQKNLLKILPGERLELIFNEENSKIVQLSKISERIVYRLSKHKQVKNQEIQSLIINIKRQSLSLNEILKQNFPSYENLRTLQRKMEDLCYQKSGIANMFQALYKKDYASYRLKRERILKKFNISQIFNQLQISEHYEQFKRQRFFKQLDLAQEKIPYWSAMSELKNFSKKGLISGTLQYIVIFHQKIRVSYNNYFKNSFKLGDMDDFLPVTIFCVLAVDCEENILGLIKMLLSQFQAIDEAEWQKKTLTDIEAAFEFILNDWKITQ